MRPLDPISNCRNIGIIYPEKLCPALDYYVREAGVSRSALFRAAMYNLIGLSANEHDEEMLKKIVNDVNELRNKKEELK